MERRAKLTNIVECTPGSQRVALRENSTLYFLLGDHLGSTAITANGSGGLYAEQRYKPWGETRYTTGTPTPTTYRFTGQREEVGLGSLYFYNARFYSSAVGRFLSPDTVVPQTENPQAWNRYSYSLSNPLKYTDPSGHCPAPPASMGPAICFALFIMPPSVSAGPYTLHGDGRDFSSNSDPGASRAYIWLSVDDGEWESHANRSGYLGATTIPDPTMHEDWAGPIPADAWYQPSSQNSWTVLPGENGEFVITYDLVLSGPLENIAPHINGTITFRPDGEGGYTASGTRDGFPWAEAYYHDGKGNVQTIFQRPAINGDPENLNAIEGPVAWSNLLYHGRDLFLNKFWNQFIQRRYPQQDTIEPQ